MILGLLGLAGCGSSEEAKTSEAKTSESKTRESKTRETQEPPPAARADGTGGGSGRATERLRPPARVTLRFDDGTEIVFGPEAFARLPSVTILSEGDVARSGWSARDLAEAAGAARISAVVGDDGARVAISTADWTDRDRSPLLRQNRRGMLKFQWMVDGAAVEGGDVRGVAALEMIRR